jgi:hypothetical protein
MVKFCKWAMEFENAISTYGLNPFSNKLCQWSTWWVYILIYNLPTWLTIKRFFMLIAMIILGKESKNITNIDVFLQSLMDKLKTFWTPCVQGLNFGKPKSHHYFNLCAMVMWTINDFPCTTRKLGPNPLNIPPMCIHSGNHEWFGMCGKVSIMVPPCIIPIHWSPFVSIENPLWIHKKFSMKSTN